MPTRKKSTTGMTDHDRKVLMDIHRDVKYITEEIAVNGSRGLEAVLRDNYTRTHNNAQAIGELKELTHNLRVNRQLRLATTDWMNAHPRIAKLINTSEKKVAWMIVAAVASYFGIEGFS